MKRVAVFGNTGGGKSTLSRRLSEKTGLPWLPLDMVQFRTGGAPVLHDEYKSAHDELLQREEWIIDGFGSMDTIWERLEVADTHVYMDLPLARHYWWATKRFLKGPRTHSAGWPEGSSLLKGTLIAYKLARLCHQKLTPRYRDYVRQASRTKTVHHLRSKGEIENFLNSF